MDYQQEQRRQRAHEQRIYFMTTFRHPVHGSKVYQILGSTGTNLYDVNQDAHGSWECSCPDFRRRHRRCKHIYFVLEKVIPFESGAPPPSTPPSPSSSTANGEALRLRSEPRPFDASEECIICFEELGSTCSLSWCRICGQSFHGHCLRLWVDSRSAAARKEGSDCPLCRQRVVFSIPPSSSLN